MLAELERSVEQPATSVRRVPAWAATAAVLMVMLAVNIAVHLGWGSLWLGPLVAVALVVFARRTGLSWSQLGLSRDRVGSGARWALTAIGVVGAAYLVGVLLPQTRSAFLDARYHLAVSGALMSAFVVIPLGTVLMEEVAFRSVLWGMLGRHLTTWRVLVATSALFGLWHILPSLHLATSNQGMSEAVQGAGGSATLLVVAGTVAFTALGGVVAGELRRRSGHLLASAGMHWATNALGVLFGLVAWRLVG